MKKTEIKERFDRCAEKAGLNYIVTLTLDEDEYADFCIDENNCLYFHDVKTKYTTDDFKSIKYEKKVFLGGEFDWWINYIYLNFHNNDYIRIGLDTDFDDFKAKVDDVYFIRNTTYVEHFKNYFE